MSNDWQIAEREVFTQRFGFISVAELRKEKGLLFDAPAKWLTIAGYPANIIVPSAQSSAQTLLGSRIKD